MFGFSNQHTDENEQQASCAWNSLILSSIEKLLHYLALTVLQDESQAVKENGGKSIHCNIFRSP